MTDPVRTLWIARERRTFLKASVLALGVITALGWGSVDPGALFTERGLQNLHRFLGELVPFPLRAPGGGVAALGPWFGQLARSGVGAVLMTVAISIVAAVLAGLGALLTAPLAARSITCSAPFEVAGGQAFSAWSLVRMSMSGAHLVARSVPALLWAFLFMTLCGLGPWPAVLALGLHNTGILGRLGAESLDELRPEVPRALYDAGGTRSQVVLFSALPMAADRLLLYFFLRWETAVRECTVLGMIGVASLGVQIQQSRAAQRYDELLVWVLIASAIVLVVETIGGRVRRRRRLR